ncbi:hypothetical protein [Streptomyces sp. NPDC021020]|uniref:hypothetical protein n=1 Tax=Streptomyces sp. NPDC021020 TaxID=3365109 RepID=UPI003797A0CA
MTDSFEFVLEPYDTKTERGVTGTVGAFGEVRVFHTRGRHIRPGDILRTEVVSERLPDTYLTNIGMAGEPYLSKKATLSVGGILAGLAYNPLGLRRSARALFIGLAGREYGYASTGEGHAVELRRGGDVRVGFVDGPHVRKTSGHRRFGTAHGPVDAMDMAIALVFERVDVAWLSTGGMLATAPFRMISSQNDGDGRAR